jgi:hypothetical protein
MSASQFVHYHTTSGFVSRIKSLNRDSYHLESLRPQLLVSGPHRCVRDSGSTHQLEIRCKGPRETDEILVLIGAWIEPCDGIPSTYPVSYDGSIARVTAYAVVAVQILVGRNLEHTGRTLTRDTGIVSLRPIDYDLVSLHD